MIPFMIEKCWQALSGINVTLSSSLPTAHPKDCRRHWHSVPYALHSSITNGKCLPLPRLVLATCLFFSLQPLPLSTFNSEGGCSTFQNNHYSSVLLATCQHRVSVPFILKIQHVLIQLLLGDKLPQFQFSRVNCVA